MTYFQSSDVQVLWSSCHLLCLLALFSVIRGLATAAVLWMLDLWSSRRTVLVEMVFQINIEFCCHLYCSSSLIFGRSTLQCTVALSLSFGFRPLFFSADDVFSLFVYVVIIFGTAALDTPNEVAVLLQMLKLNGLSSLKIWQVSDFAVLSFVLLINTICYTLTLVLHILSKQRISKDTCTWCSFSAANTDSVVPIVLVFPLIGPFTLCEVKSAQ